MKDGKILVIDDNVALVKYLTQFLSDCGYLTEFATSLMEGKKKILQDNISCVIIDLKFEIEDKENEFGGLGLFYQCYKYQISKKSIILSAYSFKEQKNNFRKQLKHLANENLNLADDILNSLENVYVHKAGSGKYAKKILSMIRMWEGKLIDDFKSYLKNLISKNKIRLVFTSMLEYASDEALKNKIILLKSRFIVMDEQRNIIGDDMSNERNKIVSVLLNTVSEIDNNDIDANKLIKNPPKDTFFL